MNEIDPSELESAQAYHHKKQEPNGKICPRCRIDRDFEEFNHYDMVEACDTCFEKEVDLGNIINCEGCDEYIWVDKAMIFAAQDGPDDFSNIYLCKKCYKEEMYEREIDQND